MYVKPRTKIGTADGKCGNARRFFAERLTSAGNCNILFVYNFWGEVSALKQPIYAKIRGAFFLAHFLTYLFPIGGLLLGFGLAIGQPAMWAIGIACIVTAFYGCTFGWVGYGNKRSLARVVTAIEEEHLYTVRELAVQLGTSEKDIRDKIDTLFRKRYLVGYIRTDSGVALNENRALAEREYTKECPSCGARVTFRGTSGECPYCGTHVERDPISK